MFVRYDYQYLDPIGVNLSENTWDDVEQQAPPLSVVHIRPFPFIRKEMLIFKRIFDVIFASVFMVLGLPIFILLYLITRFTSPGPSFFKQERKGKNGKSFYMYKFRSMYIDAEKYGPQLSSADDRRITKWGRLIRRTRLDELPQFWNVLIGDMSVVGPRPERQYFIDKILLRNPDYKKLQQIKPGLTSIGQVTFGYAENIEEMCVRMNYDLLYLDRINFNHDLQIILKTIRVMLQGKGK